MKLRNAALDWLTLRTRDGQDLISTEDLGDFTFDGEPFRLMDRQKGITKPAELNAALSIRTTWRANEADRPYHDAPGPDGLLRYKWQGEDPDHYANRALRRSMEQLLPMIWFWSVGRGIHQAIFPIYLIGEEPEHRQFIVATDGLQEVDPKSSAFGTAVTRRYFTAETKRRLHQPVFRGMVMRAYESSCAICSLRHTELLDAAHIVEDGHERGIASVTNGLALCKIHHAAYDASILGVRPDLGIEIREDILSEVDGPLLEHGLKALNGTRLRPPRARSEHPDPELLNIRYEKFVHFSR